MQNSSDIEVSWQRVSEAIGDLADCFHQNLPRARIEYVASSVILQISKYMNSVMSYLDKVDRNHGNHEKSRRTSFNFYDLRSTVLSTDKYNPHQINIIESICQACLIEASFQRDEAADFASTNKERSKQVIGSLKATRSLNLKSHKNDRYSIKISPFASHSIRKCGLTKEEVESLKCYLDNQGSSVRNVLSAIFLLRNEEQHDRPVEFEISEEKYIQVGDSGNSSNLIEALPGSRVNLNKSVIFLDSVEDTNAASNLLKKHGIAISSWLHFGCEPIPYGYRELLMPSSRLRIAKGGALNAEGAAISMSTNCCLILSEESIVRMSDVIFILKNGAVVNQLRDFQEIRDSASPLALQKSLPLSLKKIPVVSVNGAEGTVDLRDIVEWGENLKKATMDYLQRKSLL
ncbi:hypothetical protein [Leptolyngbya sp. KIOST-1]|uniref:hypothetical protein n=1 Tax=Leptolyngbya sp. KIOST-1 TaxID=1229172 RepID=UPI000A433CF2|nr:hypothetical protein [Leptolyngbya sp. KIOST-1]